MYYQDTSKKKEETLNEESSLKHHKSIFLQMEQKNA